MHLILPHSPQSCWIFHFLLSCACHGLPSKITISFFTSAWNFKMQASPRSTPSSFTLSCRHPVQNYFQFQAGIQLTDKATDSEDITCFPSIRHGSQLLLFSQLDKPIVFTFPTGVWRCECKALRTSTFTSGLKAMTRMLSNRGQFLLQPSSNFPICPQQFLGFQQADSLRMSNSGSKSVSFKATQALILNFSRKPPCKATKVGPGITHAENFQSKFRHFHQQDHCLLSEGVIFESAELLKLTHNNEHKQSMGDKAKPKHFQKDAADGGVPLSVASSSAGDGNRDLIKFKA